MKKRIGILFVLSMLVILGACGSTEVKERVFEAELGGVKSTLTYYYRGDVVVKQSTVNIVPYETIGATTKEGAKEIFDPVVEEFQGIEGVVEEVDYGDAEFTENLEIDYEKLDMDKLSDLPGTLISGDVENGISMEQSVELLLSQGYKEIE